MNTLPQPSSKQLANAMMKNLIPALMKQGKKTEINQTQAKVQEKKWGA